MTTARARRQRGPWRPPRRAARLTDADRRLLSLLESPPLRVWPRRVLAEAAGMSDRAMRDSVSNLRAAGFPVLSSSGEGGYHLAQTADEVAAWREEELSRLRVIHDRVSALEQVERLMRDREREGKPARQGALL